MDRISIIIPVYNVRNYLRRCLDSVSKQTIHDFQCILVDDGSTDGSDVICEEYTRKDSHFVVAHSQNGGPGIARNVGLDIVDSPWVTFIDSDDYVDEHYLENFLKYNEQDQFTQVIQSYHCMGYEAEDKDTLYPGTTYIYNEATVGRRSAYIEDNNILYNWAVWCKVFSMEIIRKHHIRFDERMFCSQDGIFWHHYLCHVNKLIFIPERSYTYYCPRKFNSVSRGGRFINTVNTWLVIADNYKQISAVLPQRFCMSQKYASYIKMFYWHNYFRALLKPKEITQTQLDTLKRLRPNIHNIVLTPKGIIYWILNVFPIRTVRSIRNMLP